MTEQQKYLDYLKMLRKPYQKLCRLRFLQPDGSTAFMLDNRVKARNSGAFIANGRINHNWQNGRRTSATVTLDNVDAAYDYNFNSIWFGQEIALDEGLILSDGVTEFYIQQGVFLIDSPTETVQPSERTVTYNLVDKTAALDGTLGGNLDGTYQVDAGTNIFAPIAQLLLEDKGNGYAVDRVTPVFTEYYNNKTQKLPDGTVVSMADAPYTLTIDGTDGTIWSIASGLAAMVNGWIGYDETGALRIDPSQDDILDSEKPVEWEFSLDEAELLGLAYTVKNSKIYNDYIVIGEALIAGAQPGGRAQIQDPRSPVDINAIGRKTIRVSQVGFFTNTQCEDYAVWQVKRSAVLQRAVEISCSQILHIRGNDIVTIVRTDKAGNPTERHLIQGFSRPLASAGAMTITAVSVNDFPVATIIRRGIIYDVPSQVGSLIYTGSVQVPTWDKLNLAELTPGGDLTGTDAGDYTAMFMPKAGYVWWDDTSTVKTNTWHIWKQTVQIPTQAAAITYNGSTQSVTFDGYDSTLMTISGTTSGKNAGTYTATFTLKNTTNYQWSNGDSSPVSVTWTIGKQMLTPPQVTGTYTYTGSAQTVAFSGYSSSTMTKGGTQSATNAGNYTATIGLADSSNYMWNDQTTATKSYGWSIAKRSLTIPTATGTYTYTGSAQSLAFTGYDSATMTKGGTYSATNAGSYTATISLKDTGNYMWNDQTTATKNYGWSISKRSLTIPTATGTYTYTGSAQSLVFTGYDSATMTKGGTYSATNAGSYTATITIKDTANNIWSDNTSTAKSYPWTIAKANQAVPTLSKSSASITDLGFTTFTVTRSGTGAITATSSNTNIATASVSGTTVTVSGAASQFGNATVTITVAGDSNYNAYTGTSAKFTATVTIDTTYCIKFSRSSGNVTLSTANSTKNWSGTLYWSSGATGWAVWNGTTQLSANPLYLRGTENQMISSGNTTRWVLGGSAISGSGIMETVLDYAKIKSGTMTGIYAAFQYLFSECTTLITAPSFSVSTMYGSASRCCAYMFNGCTALTTAPTLPATTLAAQCYYNMFNGCTSLTSAPALPATTLTTSCYASMFNDCTALTTAPTLPANTLASSCYSSMFHGCTALTAAPTLPANTLALSCYSEMFNGCTSLTTAPALPATTLAGNCYYNMFYGCTSLTTAPALPATTLTTYCYYSMFNGCTSLTTAPALPATTLAGNCYVYMFRNCTSLTTAPALPATTLATQCYLSMFNGCTSLKISATSTGAYTYAYRIPKSGTGTDATGALVLMFGGTGGTFTGTPTINTTYYTDHQPIS